jgi:hypothetical protein
VQRLQYGPGTRVADLTPLLGQSAADLAFDPVELADALDGFGRDQRGVRLLKFVKLAPHVRPAGGFLSLFASKISE